MKKTKIIATLGPATDSFRTIEKLVHAGMNVARLNFSHGTYAHFVKIIKNARAVAKKLNVPLALMQDLQGPKIRVGEMPEKGVHVRRGQLLHLTTKNIIGNTNHIPVQYKKLPQEVKKGDHILIADGLIELKVIRVNGSDILCTVISGGRIERHKGINVPTASLNAPCLTKKDLRDLAFGIRHGVEYVALSFVKNAKDIRKLRRILKRKKSHAKIIAKIERHEAVHNLRSIIEAADGVMVARGDLGIEIPAERVPVVQKKIIHLANCYGKPVITATQILQSMVENPLPTRAEVSDAANAILDHTDALMLSNETAVGNYPVRAVAILNKISMAIEQEIQKHPEIAAQKMCQPIGTMQSLQSICWNACDLAEETNAKLIIAITHQGFTAHQIARRRTRIPVITLTDVPYIRNQLALVWGINDIYDFDITKKHLTTRAIEYVERKGLVQTGDRIVLCNATRERKLIQTAKV